MQPKDELVRAWLTRAHDDLRLARHALDVVPALANGACFHAQQAVEKALKAVLVHREVDPPRTHVIELLMKLCTPMPQRFAELAPQCAWLTDFAVAGRYPDTLCEPTVAQAREALAVAEQAFEAILEALPPDVRP